MLDTVWKDIQKKVNIPLKYRNCGVNAHQKIVQVISYKNNLYLVALHVPAGKCYRDLFSVIGLCVVIYVVYTRGLKKYMISTYYVHLDTHKLGMHSNISPEVGSPDY